MPRKYMDREAVEYVLSRFQVIATQLREALNTDEYQPHVGAALAACLSSMEVIRASVKNIQRAETSSEAKKTRLMEDGQS